MQILVQFTGRTYIVHIIDAMPSCGRPVDNASFENYIIKLSAILARIVMSPAVQCIVSLYLSCTIRNCMVTFKELGCLTLTNLFCSPWLFSFLGFLAGLVRDGSGPTVGPNGPPLSSSRK